MCVYSEDYGIAVGRNDSTVCCTTVTIWYLPFFSILTEEGQEY
jgi:hypothetical protein